MEMIFDDFMEIYTNRPGFIKINNNFNLSQLWFASDKFKG